ncbi:hypothetical protein [Novosphingobium ginsenosidimutans]|nr:hypothetical protein [Novosphingobium ginsenosidimutans]
MSMMRIPAQDLQCENARQAPGICSGDFTLNLEYNQARLEKPAQAAMTGG